MVHCLRTLQQCDQWMFFFLNCRRSLARLKVSNITNFCCHFYVCPAQRALSLPLTLGPFSHLFHFLAVWSCFLGHRKIIATTIMENKKNIAISSSFTTNRSFNTSHIRNGKTPNKHSPSRTPARTRLGESRGAALGRTPKTPHGADRFIPDRNNINFDLSHYLVFISVCFHLADFKIFYFSDKQWHNWWTRQKAQHHKRARRRLIKLSSCVIQQQSTTTSRRSLEQPQSRLLFFGLQARNNKETNSLYSKSTRAYPRCTRHYKWLLFAADWLESFKCPGCCS